MPRVLRIINRFNLGGPTYNVAYLSKFMAPEFETLLVGGYKDPSEENSDFIVKNLGIEPVIIPEMRREINPGKDLITYKKIKQLIREFKPDIVHTHASKAGSLGRRAAYKCNVPIVVHTFHGHVFHSYFSPFKAGAFIRIEQNLAKISNRIIAVSENQKQELSEVYKIAGPDKISVIPLGFDLSRFNENVKEKRKLFRKEYRIEEDEIAVAIVGRLVPVKNHETFVRAIKYAQEKSSKKVRAFIVGDGEARNHIENTCRDLKLDFTDSRNGFKKATVTFTSWIKDIDQVYSGIDIVALTSLNEGTP
ncbi:MAG: glycosyltransferase, partial [Bacteroidetes bacterium]|nr:glycosyltransferase [Bacteroidota bacterium]